MFVLFDLTVILLGNQILRSNSLGRWFTSVAKSIHRNTTYKRTNCCPGQAALVVGASSCAPEGLGFDSHSGHIPRLQVQFPVKVRMGGSWLMFLSHIDVSLSLPSFFPSFLPSFLPPFLSPSLPLCLPSSHSEISGHVLQWGLKENSKQKKLSMTRALTSKCCYIHNTQKYLITIY